MARDVRDCAIMLENMAGFDPKDATSLDLPVPQWEAGLSSDLKGKRVGIPSEYRIDGVPDEINALWDQGIAWLKDAGAEIVEISLPHTKYALPAYYIIAPAEASSNLARYDGVRYGLRELGVKSLDDMYAATRAAGFGDEVKRRIMIGTYVLSAGFYDAYFTKAQKVRTLIKRDFAEAFDQVRRDPRPDRAVGGVRPRREDERSAGDVSQRRVRGARQPRRPAGDERSGRARRAGASARPAPDRPRARRAGRAQRRPRDRGARRLHPSRGEMVVSDYRIEGATGEWEVVIGLEVHAQVVSNAKLFSGASTTFGAEPNTQVSLVDAAMPGMLPVPNRECIRQAVRTGMAIDAKINKWSRFDRKNYFYADLPQGYQISPALPPAGRRGRNHHPARREGRDRARAPSASSASTSSRTPAS